MRLVNCVPILGVRPSLTVSYGPSTRNAIQRVTFQDGKLITVQGRAVIAKKVLDLT
jgi:hypothetical protein